MGVNKLTFGGRELINLTDATVTTDTLEEGVTAYGATGDRITGTGLPGRVRYDIEQLLTKEEQQRAQNNLGISTLSGGTGVHIDAEEPVDKTVLWLDTDDDSGTDSGSSGGAALDVVAEVGQTIVVEEVDATGKPTKWKAVEYQERTHWTEEIEIVPLTEFTPDYNDMIGAPMADLNYFELVAGRTYKVIFDGVEYICEATSGTFAGIAFSAIGNKMLASGVDTGEPFGVVKVVGAEVGAVITFDTNPHSVQVLTEVVTKVPTKFVPTLEEMRNTETVILPETQVTVEEDLWLIPGFVPVNGETYHITWNGEVYNCTATVMTEDGWTAVVLGNIALMEGTGDTGEPFVMVYIAAEFPGGVIVMPTNDSGDTIPTVEITTIKPSKIDPKFLPEGIGYIDGSSVIIPETELTLQGTALLLPGFIPEAGSTYTITWNGVPYVCTAIDAGINNIIAVGNVAAADGTGNTGEPFVMIYFPDDMPDGVIVRTSEDYGDTIPVVSVSGETIHKIDPKFLPEVNPLPEVSSSNNGAFLRVVDGVWAAVQLPNAEEGVF